MAHNKITRINKQVIPTDGVKTEFSDLDVAKSFYYTDKELALFDTWKNQIQWAIVNDDDSKPSWLKVTIDFANVMHLVTLNQNSSLAQTGSSNVLGQSGSIFLVQDGTGSRTLSYSSHFKFPGGTAPTLSTAANAVDRLDYIVKANGEVHAVVTLDVK